MRAVRQCQQQGCPSGGGHWCIYSKHQNNGIVLLERRCMCMSEHDFLRTFGQAPSLSCLGGYFWSGADIPNTEFDISNWFEARETGAILDWRKMFAYHRPSSRNVFCVTVSYTNHNRLKWEQTPVLLSHVAITKQTFHVVYMASIWRGIKIH